MVFYFSLKTTSSVRCACFRACADQLLLVLNQALLKRSHWKRISSRDQWNLTPATMCRGSAARAVRSRRFGAADHALAQMWPRQILTCTFSKTFTYATIFGHRLELWHSYEFINHNCEFISCHSEKKKSQLVFIFELVAETSFHRFERVKTNPF